MGWALLRFKLATKPFPLPPLLGTGGMVVVHVKLPTASPLPF